LPHVTRAAYAVRLALRSPTPRASRRAAMIHLPIVRGWPQAPSQRTSIGGQQVDEHMLQSYFHAFQIYVAYVSLGCFKSRSAIAYVAIAIHICCKCRFQMFQLFQTYVASVLSECCICCNDYTRMLQVYVSTVSNLCYKCFI
jgi:hypothetical protein